MQTVFYTYLWLRENGTPYYAGKGHGKRAFVKEHHRFSPPTNKKHILVQEFPDEPSAFAAEKFLISYYGRKDNGTGCLRNLTDGGEGPAGRVAPAAERLHNSEVRKGPKNHFFGRKHTPEALAKMSRKGCSYPGPRNLGKTHSPETKLKMSLAAKRRWRSAETKLKMKLAAKKRWQSAEARRNISEKRTAWWAAQRAKIALGAEHELADLSA